MTNSSILMDAYWQSMKECDSPSDAAIGAMATSTSAFTFLAIYSIGVFLQLCILPANLRLAKHRSAFLLLLHINFLDLIWLLQYIWLCFEFIILGRRLHIPASLDAYLFRLVNFCIDALYFQLALNRAMAVLDASGRIFERLFNQKNNKFYLLFTWSAGILYSFYSNWHPVRRPFHCLSQLGYFEPTSTIPKNLLALLPDSIFYDGIQQFYMICIYIPILLYIAAFIKLFHKFIDRLFAANSGSIEPLHPFNPDNNKFHAQFANLALERSRLFLLCFFSQLPYLLANGLDHLTRIFQLNEQMVKNMAILGQFFGTIFHVQQPILMLLLSKDMRREVREDIRRYFRK